MPAEVGGTCRGKIENELRLDLSDRERRLVRSGLAVLAVLIVGGIGLANAAPIDTAWVAPNQPVVANLLKANLDGLQQQINKPTIVRSGRQYSLGATYCGKTTASTNGQIPNGYAGTKFQCEAVAACGNSPSAHMCSSEELVRSASLGVIIESGWYSSAVVSMYPGCSGGTCGSTQLASDCMGWTSNNGAEYGLAWQWGGRPLHQAPCTTVLPVLCCD